MASPTSLNNPNSNISWAQVSPYLASPIAASIAIIPPFYGFVAKSAKQIGEPVPRLTLHNSIIAGVKAAPTIGIIVGTQLAVQDFVEGFFAKYFGKKDDFRAMVASTMVVGGISAPALAVFNGQTMGKTVAISLKTMTLAQASAIVLRETSFLLSIRVSKPVSDSMKEKAGDNKAIQYASVFFTGTVGALFGQPADAILTRLQKGMKLSDAKSALMKGAGFRALAAGTFNLGFNLINDLIKK